MTCSFNQNSQVRKPKAEGLAGRQLLSLAAAAVIGLTCFPLRAAESLKPRGTNAATGAESPKAATTNLYVRDIEFLLTELESKAGALLKLKGVDWAAVSQQFRQEAAGVTNDAAHVRLCIRLLARLRDGHAGLTDLTVRLPEDNRNARLTGPRLHLIAQGTNVFVRQAFGSAEELGFRPGVPVTKIDGRPARDWLDRRVVTLRDETGYSTEQQALYAACHWGLADQSGTRIEFEVLEEAQPRTIAVTRQGGPNFAPLGPIFPPGPLRSLGRQSYTTRTEGVGYLHLRDVPDELPAQLDRMLATQTNAPGLILDLRANGGGGCDHAAVFARFLAPGEIWRQYTNAGTTGFSGPLVVIVDSGTRSAGETIAGMLKEDGRAYLIGDGPTAGMSSQKATVTLPSRLFAVRFSVASNKARFNDGRGIEGIGVAPHELVPYNPAELLKGVDTLIRHAEELLTRGLPAGVVPYEAKRGR